VWPAIQEYLDFQIFDPATTYDKFSTVFVSNWINQDSWLDEMNGCGYKVAIDTLWEPQVPTQQHYEIRTPQWFWFNTCLSFLDLGYENYTPNKTFSKLALMPMYNQKDFRDRLIQRLGPRLEKFIYSYVDRRLPNDITADFATISRYINPNWYDDTCFSLVVESTADEIPFVTEKTFKPCAFRQPFIMLASTGSLKSFRSWGFESYSNLFDESYDEISNLDDKISNIIKNIDSYHCTQYDTITLQKIEHNHHQLFNRALVVDKIKKSIIDPLISYVNSR
jgi:hypothetical protein